MNRRSLLKILGIAPVASLVAKELVQQETKDIEDAQDAKESVTYLGSAPDEHPSQWSGWDKLDDQCCVGMFLTIDHPYVLRPADSLWMARSLVSHVTMFRGVWRIQEIKNSQTVRVDAFVNGHHWKNAVGTVRPGEIIVCQFMLSGYEEYALFP